MKISFLSENKFDKKVNKLNKQFFPFSLKIIPKKKTIDIDIFDPKAEKIKKKTPSKIKSEHHHHHHTPGINLNSLNWLNT